MRSFIAKYKWYVVTAALLVLGVAAWMGSYGGMGGLIPEGSKLEFSLSNSEAPTFSLSERQAAVKEAPSSSASAISIDAWYDQTDSLYWYEPVASPDWEGFNWYDLSGDGTFNIYTPEGDAGGGSYCLAIAPYFAYEDDNITSSMIDIPHSEDISVRLSFNSKYDLEAPSEGKTGDYMEVQLDGGDGSGWRTLDTLTGTNADWPEWTTRCISLPANAGNADLHCKLRFRFVSDVSGEQWGCAIDDVRVFGESGTTGDEGSGP